jgi:hypothetical protein
MSREQRSPYVGQSLSQVTEAILSLYDHAGDKGAQELMATVASVITQGLMGAFPGINQDHELTKAEVDSLQSYFDQEVNKSALEANILTALSQDDQTSSDAKRQQDVEKVKSSIVFIMRGFKVNLSF